ncbi:MAG: hypothetical protein V4508_13940 [Pseudomonadota bacterium]
MKLNLVALLLAAGGAQAAIDTVDRGRLLDVKAGVRRPSAAIPCATSRCCSKSNSS